VDHPRVINGYRGKSNDLIERFMAGCVSPRDFLESLDNSVSQTDKDEIEKKLNQKKKQKRNLSSSSTTGDTNDIEPKSEVKKSPTGTLDPKEIKLIDNLIIDESAYFDFIDGNYPNYFKTTSEKIKYFQPGFHSITPEGLNSRLTFLQQCMRQGPSIYDRVTNKDGNETGVQPQNLSFGRPPICILRIGDFFYTKIAINSLSITYEGGSGIQWDLNPEGIGVQPMIASVQLSIDLIGGHSLSGPLNRLQNAISYNYYANTEIYDPRADKIVDGVIEDGIKFENSGDDQDEGKEGIIKIELTPTNTNEGAKTNDFVINVTTPKLPSETQVGKKENSVDSENELVVIVRAGSTTKEPVPQNTTKIPVPFSDLPGLIEINNVLTYKKNIETLEGDIVDLQEDFKNSNVPSEKKIIKQKITTKKSEKETEELKLKNELKKESKIRVEAYFSKSKNKTRVKQTFTISEDGIN
jgi:hypothetical protein